MEKFGKMISLGFSLVLLGFLIELFIGTLDNLIYTLALWFIAFIIIGFAIIEKIINWVKNKIK